MKSFEEVVRDVRRDQEGQILRIAAGRQLKQLAEQGVPLVERVEQRRRTYACGYSTQTSTVVLIVGDRRVTIEEL